MDKIELKPCPFCGGEAYIFETPTYHTRSHPYSIRCNLCDLFFGWDADRGKCGGLYETREEAAAAWNRRADDTGWIPTKDRLPKPYEEVLVFPPYATGICAAYLTAPKPGQCWVVPLGGGITHLNVYAISQWRPLPAPPAKGNGEAVKCLFGRSG